MRSETRKLEAYLSFKEQNHLLYISTAILSDDIGSYFLNYTETNLLFDTYIEYFRWRDELNTTVNPLPTDMLEIQQLIDLNNGTKWVNALHKVYWSDFVNFQRIGQFVTYLTLRHPESLE